MRKPTLFCLAITHCFFAHSSFLRNFAHQSRTTKSAIKISAPKYKIQLPRQFIAQQKAQPYKVFAKRIMSIAPVALGTTVLFNHEASNREDSTTLPNYTFKMNPSSLGDKAACISALDTENKNIGSISYKIKNKQGYIAILRVNKEHRHKKVGTILFDKAIDHITLYAKENKMRSIKISWEAIPLDANQKLGEIVLFYQKRGAKVIHIAENLNMAYMELEIKID